MAGMTKSLTKLQKSDKYHRALSLNLDCGSDTLRKLIDNTLDVKNVTLKKHLQDVAVQSKVSQLKKKKVIYGEQLRQLNSKKPDLLCMDISLLTIVLLELISTTTTQDSNIRKLRRKRNELVHKSQAQLDDDIPFNEASQIILDLSKDVSPEFESEIKLQIQELKRRELVCTHSNIDIVKLHNESLMVKLVEGGNDGKVDENNEVWIKYRLTKSVRTLSQFLEVDAFLQELFKEGVIDESTKKTIEQTYNYEEQMHLLVLHIMEESKEKVLKFCVCLRKINSLLADLLEVRSHGDADIDKVLKEEEHTKIKTIIGSCFSADTSESVACEDVHILIDDKRKCSTRFDSIKACVMELFPDVSFKENDSKFHDIKWLENSNFTTKENDPEEIDDNLSDMPSDKFGEYLNVQMERSRTGIGCLFENTVLEECLSSEIFANLTSDQLEEIFSPKLKEAKIKFGYGIKTSLVEIQKKIKKHMIRSSLEKNDILRKFDTPPDNTIYTRCTVRPPSGNLLVPVHEFVLPRSKGHETCSFIGKEIIRFATACINGKKNGTIHFGIKDVGNGNGEIVGLHPEALILAQNLDLEIRNSINYCFEQATAPVAKRCIRPVQIVHVEDNRIVLEVDVVSFSSHVPEEIIGIMFPPKGNQRKKYFVYRENMIATIEQSRLGAVQSDIEKLFLERVQLEKDVTLLDPCKHQVSQNRHKLIKLMTGGNRLVTDAYTPILFCGDISGCTHEEGLREHMSNMAVAFTSSAAVFDFGSSVDLRNNIEKEKYIFQVKVAEDSSTKRFRRESDTFGDKTLWIYSNGNDELEKDKMDTGLWYKKRLDGVKNTLFNLRQQIPNDRGLVIFLVFQKFIERDPMLEVARDCFLTTFRGECIIIAESEDVLQEWRKEFCQFMTKREIENKTVTGLKWEDIVPVIGSIFSPLTEVTFKLPNSKGSIVEVNHDEKECLKLHDIDIVDGFAEENCRLQESTMTETEWRQHRSEEEKHFYKGNAVTWWNFYYANHVGKRDAFDIHKDEIKEKIQSKDRESKYEIHTIKHHPGAGGSTLGRHLIWYFSQLKPKHPEDAYRCCIVNKVTEATAEEIYRFQSFKEPGGATKPVIVLIDNETEDHLNILKPRLDEIAYKRGSPGNLFCLLIIVTRVPVSYVSRGDVVLKHHLTKNEKSWFEKKFKELETNCNVNVKTLIAFNVMRNSFNNEFIAEITKELMKEVTMKELNLLKCLSLICSFESDHPVPETVFDSLMVGGMPSSNRLNIGDCLGKPFGLVWSARNRAQKQPIDRETWNVNITEAMQLLVTHRRVDEANCYNAVCILSQPLAESVLNYIMDVEKSSFEDIVLNLLDLLRQHMKETNQMSKRFVKLVCSLFKTRQVQEVNKGETKLLKFSDLVLKLEQQLPGEDITEAQQRVVKIMSSCFHISNDANIGQQLARFNNHICDYEAAEDAILRSLKVFPKNSYFLDTYGQILKSRMENVIQRSTSQKIGDGDAADFVKFAVCSVRKFREAQDAAESNDDFTHTNCYNMEVVTALQMLEHFHLFECYTDKENFWQFLNDPEYDIEKSSFNNLLHLSDELLHFRNGQSLQHHMENSLSFLETTAYMTKSHLSPVMITAKDMLLLKPRERFLRFYGSKEHTLNFEFMYGVGLKMLMTAYRNKKHSQLLTKRAKEADRRLQQQDTRETERDLLVYLGYTITILSNHTAQCDSKLYHKLLKYCTQLMELQRKKAKKEMRSLEAYLYYALLHWPIPQRIAMENLSHPETYRYLLEEWEHFYFENHRIKRREQLSLRKPKLFFALGNDMPGRDIVDLEMLRHKWRAAKSKEGRNRKEVKADDNWRHPIFENCLTRLLGTVDPTGRSVTTKVEYEGKTYEFKVNTIENYSYLSNRVVTFVLGFSWMALTALDVMRGDWKFGRQVPQLSITSKGMGHCDNTTFPLQDQVTSSQTIPVQTGKRPKPRPKDKREYVGLEGRGEYLVDTTVAARSVPQKETKDKGRNKTKSGKRPGKQLSSAFENANKEKSNDVSSKKLQQTQKELPEECPEEWQEVKSRKKRNIPPATPLRPVYSSTEPEWKKENFQRLVSKLQSEFPDSTRVDVVEAYNEVKNVHGSLDGMDLKFIMLEVSRQLKKT